MVSDGGGRLVETKSVIGGHDAMVRPKPRPHPCGCGRVRAASGRGSRASATSEFMRGPRDYKTVVRVSSPSPACGNTRRRGMGEAGQCCDCLCSPTRSEPGLHVHVGAGAGAGVGAHACVCRCKNQQQDHDENNRSSTSSTRRANCSTQRADCDACDCQLDSMVRDTPAQGLVATVKRLSGHSALEPHARLSPDTELVQAPPPSSSPHHHTAHGNPCKPTTSLGPTTISKHASTLSSPNQPPTQTPYVALQNRQIPPLPPSPSTAAAGTYIQDPSLGLLLSGTITSTATPSNLPSNPSISTAVIVTIVLGTIAGIVTFSLAVILINMRLRRRRRRRGQQPSSSLDSDKKGLSANASSTVLNSPGLVTPFPNMAASSSPTALGTEIPAGSANDVGLDELRPPPRLGERKFHQTTRSEGSIDVRPSRNFHHTRWGKPSSLGNIPSAKDIPSYYAGDAQMQDHEYPDMRATARNHQYTLFPTRTTTPTVKTHKPAASTSTTSTLQGTSVTPPRTPKSSIPSPVNGLVSPGPPPTRALPSPPFKYWQVNPLSPPLDSQMDHVRPEEIGIAIGSPIVEERREKRPRLDESDMERLGGTYSPFKR